MTDRPFTLVLSLAETFWAVGAGIAAGAALGVPGSTDCPLAGFGASARRLQRLCPEMFAMPMPPVHKMNHTIA